MMNSIAPFWDGNETWLVLGGGGLLAAFPLAYAILMPALYIPVILMLLGLIFRGVAFEFRFKAHRSRIVWDYAFHLGSLTAAYMQGVIIGTAVQGITVSGRSFAGGPFDWCNAYSQMTGLGLVLGYGLLGATWLVMKTGDDTQAWARRSSAYLLIGVGVALLMVSVSMPLMSEEIRRLWFARPNIYYLALLPSIAAALLVAIWIDLNRGREYRPFLLSIGVFLACYLGLGVSLWPWLIPFAVTFREAAAAGPSQSLLLVGTVFLLPMILGYTAFCYYLFRGKVSHEAGYH
jgi:cytochrome d ubiquinol oxidase subunit II